MADVVALDLGTSYFKAALFSDDGQLRAGARQPVSVTGQAPQRCELPIATFDQALRQLIRELEAKAPQGLDHVAALSFSSQTNSFVLLDAHDQPLTPLILWPDARCGASPPANWSELTQRDDFRQRTGVARPANLLWPAKWDWLKQHQPDLARKTRRICLISDYLTYRLTHRHWTEAGVAGLTGLLDLDQLDWWDAAIDTMQLDRRWLPSVVRAGTDAGPLRPQAAQTLGLPADCRLIIGCLDQYAGAIGAGNVGPGQVSQTTGTVLASVRCATQRGEPLARGVFQGPAFEPGRWFQMVFGSRSANLLQAYRDAMGDDAPSFEQLVAEAATVPLGAEGVKLRPGVEDDLQQPLVQGLTDAHTRGHAVRAILEGVAAALKRQVQDLAANDRPAIIRSVGGAARSDTWLQIKADMLNLPVQAMACDEPTSQGAALLALGTLTGEPLAQLVPRMIQVRRQFDPDPDRASIYADLFGESSQASEHGAEFPQDKGGCPADEG